jgi:ankyrin repeat protein
MVAITYQDIELVKKILERPNININSQNKRGQTPLMYAYQLKNRDIIHLLKSHDADESIEDNKGRTVEWYKDPKNATVFLEEAVHELGEHKDMIEAVRTLTSLKSQRKGGKKKRTNKKRKSRRSFTRSIMRLFSK